ncbi:MAG: aldolase [Bacteroidales bacterium]|nr:aldolase [Bacteroidales bacterium]
MKRFELMILADTPETVEIAQEAGVDRIFYDLEYVGKAERQHGRNTVLSYNDIEKIPEIRKIVTTSKLLVRTNPIHAYTAMEVEKAIQYGADILMLPMVMDHHDVEKYVQLVRGRTKVCIMIETAAAMARIDKILAVTGVDELFIGLNDLHISMGLTFMFELLSDGLVEYIADKCNNAGIPFGFGGIARIGEGMLPSDYILGEHVRLGSSSVILSRTFKGVVGVDTNARPVNLKEEVDKVRKKIVDIKTWDKEAYTNNRKKIEEAVDAVIVKMKEK